MHHVPRPGLTAHAVAGQLERGVRRLGGETLKATMDIEISIRTGNRKRLESGTVKWESYQDSSHLVTYSADERGAVREALFQVERMLRDLLGLQSMQGE